MRQGSVRGLSAERVIRCPVHHPVGKAQAARASDAATLREGRRASVEIVAVY